MNFKKLPANAFCAAAIATSPIKTLADQRVQNAFDCSGSALAATSFISSHGFVPNDGPVGEGSFSCEHLASGISGFVWAVFGNKYKEIDYGINHTLPLGDGHLTSSLGYWDLPAPELGDFSKNDVIHSKIRYDWGPYYATVDYRFSGLGNGYMVGGGAQAEIAKGHLNLGFEYHDGFGESTAAALGKLNFIYPLIKHISAQVNAVVPFWTEDGSDPREPQIRAGLKFSF